MSPEIAAELRLLARSVGAGVRLALAYGGLLFARGLFRHRALWVGAEDVIYWCLSAFYVFLLLFQENDSVLRLYVMAALLLTRAVSLRILRRILRKVLKKRDRCYKMVMPGAKGQESDASLLAGGFLTSWRCVSVAHGQRRPKGSVDHPKQE